MNCIQRILMPLTGAAFILICGVVSSQAAFLNDIRVGDYKDHTRIVLELSATPVIERITPRMPGQLTINLAATHPRLVRKIPIERSQRIKDIRLWYQHNKFTVALTFAFEHFRYEVIKFKNPDRIALDIYQLASTPLQSMSEKNKNAAITTPSVAEVEKQLPIIADDSKPLRLLSSTGTVPHAGIVEKQADAPKDDHTANAARRALPPNPVAQKPMVSPPNKPGPLPDMPPDTTLNHRGMQFYLVVGLVILTIVILVLLLLMLLMKQRWIDGETPLNASEYLQRQDKRIAALDTQIQEQLKRYDEA